MENVRPHTHTLGAMTDGTSDNDELVKKTKVLAVIKALPGVGTVRAAQLLEEAQIVDTRRVGGLGARQREALISAAS